MGGSAVRVLAAVRARVRGGPHEWCVEVQSAYINRLFFLWNEAPRRMQDSEFSLDVRWG